MLRISKEDELTEYKVYSTQSTHGAILRRLQPHARTLLENLQTSAKITNIFS